MTGVGRGRVQVTLFCVQEPFTSATLADPWGEFHFHALTPGDYTISVLKSSLGATRRTVVVGPGADEKGAIHIEIAYEAAEAAGVSGGIVSKNSLCVPARPRSKYEDAQKRLEKHDPEGATKT